MSVVLLNTAITLIPPADQLRVLCTENWEKHSALPMLPHRQSSAAPLLLYLFPLLPGNQANPTWSAMAACDGVYLRLPVAPVQVWPLGVRTACLRPTLLHSSPCGLDFKYARAHGYIFRPLCCQSRGGSACHSADKLQFELHNSGRTGGKNARVAWRRCSGTPRKASESAPTSGASPSHTAVARRACRRDSVC